MATAASQTTNLVEENDSTIRHTGNLLLVVTGASRGFGKAVVQAFGALFSQANDQCQDGTGTTPGYLYAILVARSSKDLQETIRSVQEMPGANGAVDFSCHEVDLSDLDQLESRLRAIVSEISELSSTKSDTEKKKFDQYILISNAGALGYVGPCIKSPSLADMRKSVDTNVTSALWLSVLFAGFVHQAQMPGTIVNVSSLVALHPFPTMAIYSAGKAARDSFTTAMALELKEVQQERQQDHREARSSQSQHHPTIDESTARNDPFLRFLNYAPGPLETDMAEELRNSHELANSLKPHFQKTLVNPMDSANVLVRLVMSKPSAFMSGQHVDYYDCI